ncbi:maturation protein [ssRNA phage SRR6960799_26]|uniref:Maturation protein n=1 Tax=ssRNA phage SRR6960799_26 TaxID=2786583 RepID=A0A8S5KZR3_9VIRU|nr:maturation protein [ssRNA phage SRR6960799_26]DAD50671.1 TPA_asm: maturation protein [ssRNA phage SRR6960799_26]
MNPITGPTVKVTNDGFTDTIRVRYKQARPYNLVLPYKLQAYTGQTRSTGYTAHPTNPVWTDSGWIKDTVFGINSLTQRANQFDHLVSKAWEKLQNKVHDQAGWAENIAQFGQARTMFNDRSVQLFRVVKALSTFRFGEAAAVVTERLPRYHRDQVTQRLLDKKLSKDLASNFLEFEYGWRPLVNDIRSSIKVMTSDPGERSCSSIAKSDWSEDHSFVNHGVKSGQRVSDKRTASYCVRMGARFAVSNPNLALASQLGFIDPALPWKLMPYSFVVDWFVNVEQVISATTAWCGLSVVSPYTTIFARCHRDYASYAWSESLILPGSYDTGTVNTRQSSVEMERISELTGPVLHVRPFKGFGVERGAQALALVIGLLK